MLKEARKEPLSALTQASPDPELLIWLAVGFSCHLPLI